MRLAVATTEAAEFTWRAALSQAEEEGSQLVQVEGLLLCRRCLLAGAKLHGLEQHVLAALRGQPGVECSPETSARLAGCVTTGVALPLELSEALSEPAAVQAVWLSLTLSLSRAWRAVGYLRNAYAEERQASALLATYGLHDAATRGGEMRPLRWGGCSQRRGRATNERPPPSATLRKASTCGPGCASDRAA